MELQSPHRNAGRRYDYNDDLVPPSLSSEPLQPYLVWVYLQNIQIIKGVWLRVQKEWSQIADQLQIYKGQFLLCGISFF